MTSDLFSQESAARELEAVYTTPDVVAQRLEVLRALSVAPGEHVLDVGVGPGFLAADVARAVGAHGRVCGIDVSESMLALARVRCDALPVDLRLGDALRLPYSDATFDAAVSTQVYEYVADVDAALRELRRTLKPDARVVILDTDWDSIVWNSRDRARMERVLEAWAAHCAHPRLPRALARHLQAAGFEVRARSVVPVFNPVADPNTYSHGIARFIARFVAARDGMASEAQLWTEDLQAAADAGEYFFSLNRYLFVAVASRDRARTSSA